MKNVTEDIYYVGVNDHKIDLFEGQYVVPNGMAYNSYVIVDDKVVVMDTVDVNFTKPWLENADIEQLVEVILQEEVPGVVAVRLAED